MSNLSIKEKAKNGLPVIMATRFVRLIFKIDEAAIPIIIEGSANFHPHIDSCGNYFKDTLGVVYNKIEGKARIEFESVYDENIIFPYAGIKIYNLPFVNSPLETMDFKSQIKIEAGYNGFNLETLFEGHLLAKPFVVSEKEQNYTYFQITTRKEQFKNTKIFNTGLNEAGDSKVKHFLNQIKEGKEEWGDFYISIPEDPETNRLLEKEINISFEYCLEDAIRFLGNILDLKFVYYNGIFNSFKVNDCKKATIGKILETEISEWSILSFEDVIKETAEDERQKEEIEIKETAEYFKKAEERELVNNYSGTYFQGISTAIINLPKTNAVLNLLIVAGKAELGQAVKFKIEGMERRFIVKSISSFGDTHGLTDNFKTILELV